MKGLPAVIISLCLCLWTCAAPAQEPGGPGSTLLLTNIAQVRALSTEQAKRGYRVRIRATVTFQTHLGNFFIHDLTNGIYVARMNAAFDLHPGQIVEFEGVTEPGDYAPVAEAERVRVLGEGKLPTARQVPFDELGSSQEDCQWVEVRGIVRTAAQVAENRFEIELAVAGSRLRVYLLEPPPGGLTRIVDSTVRLRGVRGCIFNQKRQVLAPLLLVNAGNSVVEELAPEDPFATLVRPLPSLLQFMPDSHHGHRIKVRSVVFNAHLAQAERKAPFKPPPDRSRLRLTGVCLVQDVTERSSTVKPDSFRVLLRSPADVALLEKPLWWTPRRLVWLLSVITVLFLAVLGAVIARSKLKLLAQSRERAEAEGRFLAIMAERNRMAREIHDTLAQGYTAI
jgi:hypothetical protein